MLLFLPPGNRGGAGSQETHVSTGGEGAPHGAVSPEGTSETI